MRIQKLLIENAVNQSPSRMTIRLPYVEERVESKTNRCNLAQNVIILILLTLDFWSSLGASEKTKKILLK